jgi:hypothetical protein
VFGSAPETHDEEQWAALRNGAPAWLCYDPFEGPEYTYLSWEGIGQRVMERLVGATFPPEDLTSEGERIVFRTQWGVMF